MKVLVTGGAGFIGSAVCRHLVAEGDAVVNLDKLTYAATRGSTAALEGQPRYSFEQADICDAGAVERVFAAHAPDAVLHLAAESHVDRSITGSAAFIATNVVGTHTLLEAALRHWRGLPPDQARAFRFVHVSTDEVYGALGEEGLFREDTAYDPRSPYSASKAASDHLASAWGHTYGLPVMISNCSNNYGPFHFPEKLIPLTILKALEGQPLPVYGDGAQVRDWLFVQDHARALRIILQHGRPGHTYNVGGRNERRNLEVVQAICDGLDEMAGDAAAGATPAADHLRHRPAGPRPPLRHRRHQAGGRTGLARPAHLRPPAYARPSAGIWTTPGGGGRCRRATTAAGWACSPEPKGRPATSRWTSSRRNCEQQQQDDRADVDAAQVGAAPGGSAAAGGRSRHPGCARRCSSCDCAC